MSCGVFDCLHINNLGLRQSRRVQMAYASLSRLIWPQLPLTALLTLYFTTAGFPFSTTKWPAPKKSPVSRPFSFSSPVSNLISMTRVVISSRSRDWQEKDRHNSNGAKQEKRKDLGGSSANTYTNCQTPWSSRPGSRSTTILAQESYLQRQCKRGTLDHRSCLWDTSNGAYQSPASTLEGEFRTLT